MSLNKARLSVESWVKISILVHCIDVLLQIMLVDYPRILKLSFVKGDETSK